MCSVRRSLALVLLTVVLIGCGAPAPTTTAPAPLPVLAVTPSLAPWVAHWLASYAESAGAPGFTVAVHMPAAGIEAVQDARASLLVAAIEPPPGWFATPLGIEPITIIIHPSNPIRDFDLQELMLLYTGQIRSWSGLGGSELPVTPLLPLAGDEGAETITTVVLQDSPVTPYTLLAPSPEAMVAMVAEDPGAIGFIPVSQGAEGVSRGSIDGLRPSPSDLSLSSQPLILSVIAMAPDEPSGPLQDWLAWIQAAQISD